MKFKRWLPPAVVAALLVVYLTIGLGGIDFGYCWDEPMMVLQVRDSLQNKLLLPTGEVNQYWPELKGGNYEYPMVLYWIGLGTAGPEMIHRGIRPTGPATSFTDSYDYQLRLRRVCLSITSLAVVWTALAAGLATRRWGTAVFAGGLVAASWEYAYHGRFIATDAVMAQFAAATLWLCLAAIRATDSVHRRRWLIAAAVLAGLTMGTKYPGGMLAVPLLAAGWVSYPPGKPFKQRLLPMAKLFAVQVAVFAITTPGMFLQPWNFFGWVWYDHLHYGLYGHGVHTIRNHIAHLSAIVQFVCLTLLSPSTIGSVAVAGLSLIGAVRLLWTDRRAAAVVVLFPILYAGYFATQVAEIVRNLLVLLPFLAVSAAVGADTIFDGIARLRGRARSVGNWTVSTAMTGVVVGSLVWQAVVMHRIRTPHGPDVLIAAARDYISAHPGLSVYPTDEAARAIGVPLIPASPGSTPVILAMAHENGNVLNVPANIRHFARAVFGVPEINPDDYPDWLTDSVVVIDLANARRVPSTEIEQAVARRDRSVTAPAGFALGPCLIAGGGPTAESDGVTIRCQSPTVAMPLVPAASMPGGSRRWTDPSAVTFSITGLRPDRPYLIGWSWWDVDGTEHRESVCIGSSDPANPMVQIAPPTALPAWTADRPSWRWPPPAVTSPPVGPLVAIPPAAYGNGRCELIVRRETGLDATVSSVWIDLPRK